MGATFDWKNRGRTPALNVESFEWDALGKKSADGFHTIYTSSQRHMRYNNVWVDGMVKTATLYPGAAELPPFGDRNLRLFGVIIYRDFFATNTYHIYYCYDVVPNAPALFPCPEPELNRID